MEATTPERHSLPRTVLLHLLPGVLITAVFVAIASIAVPRGAPASLALLITWLVAGIPLLLGYLLYQGRKRNGRFSLDGIVLYRAPLRIRDYLWLVTALLVWTAVVSTLLFPLGEAIRQALFPWWPEWLVLSGFVQHLKEYSEPVLWATVLLSFALNIAVPIVEEMYFRGYLLPRIAHWGAWAPLASVLLFSLYHFWLPWDNASRVVALLPLVYAVAWKRNIYIGILVHVLLNTLGSIGLLALVLSRS
jgi:membrane protease YdiL (CAAX protease family)